MSRSKRFEGRRLLIRGQTLECLFNHEEGGFTLVETLGAFTALTLVLIVLLAGLSGAVRGSRHADTMREALRLAQSKLDSLGVTEPLTPGESTGRFGNGFEWRLANPRGAKRHYYPLDRRVGRTHSVGAGRRKSRASCRVPCND